MAELDAVYREIRILARDHRRLALTYQALANEMQRAFDIGKLPRTDRHSPIEKTQNSEEQPPAAALKGA